MNKGLFIAISAILLVIFGVVIYYGMQALEPHTYVPQADDSSSNASTTTPVALTPLPALPALPSQPVAQSAALAPTAIAGATSSPETAKEPVKVLATEDQLAYLATSTLRELNPEKLFFAPKDAQAFPYGKDSVFIIERPSNLVRTSLWSLNTTTKTVTRIAGPAFGLTARWSKNGRYIFTASADEAGALSLSFIDTKLKTTTPLRMATLPSKCFITDSAPLMYCGVPQGAPQGTILPDDYLMGSFIPSDRLMKIDFKSPKVTELWNGESTSLDIINPALIGTDLFFTNKTDGVVWKLSL